MASIAGLVDPSIGTEHVRGAEDAPVTLVEYGDFECPNCKQAAPVCDLMLKRFAGRVRLVYRHFPLEEVHPHALLAAEAAEAAAAQGKFWEMHDALFAHQHDLQLPHLRELARELGLEQRRFATDLGEHVYLRHVRAHEESGRASGVRATPTFFLNRSICDVSFGVQTLERSIEAALRALP
jgi:protein-disulfide isomerase